MWYSLESSTLYASMHQQGKYRHMDSVSRHILEMDWGSEQGPRLIEYIFVNEILYIKGKGSDLSQCPYLTLKSEILRIGWPSIILGVIPTPYRVYTTNVIHSHRKQKTGLKWASQLITQIWRFAYGKWTQCSKLKHSGESFSDHSNELILDADIAYEQERGQDALPELYHPYFVIPLYIILDTSIMARKLVPPNQEI